MFRVLHPNRWFFYALAVLLATGLWLLAATINTSIYLDGLATELLNVPQSSWRTFSSRALGLSLSYPPGWRTELDPLLTYAVYFEDPAHKEEQVSLYVVDPEFGPVIRGALEVAAEREIVIDEQTGSWLLGATAKDPATRNVVFLPHGGKLFYIAGHSSRFEKMVKSIRFLE